MLIILYSFHSRKELVCGRTTRRLKRKEQNEKSTLGGILGDLGYSGVLRACNNLTPFLGDEYI